MANNNSEFGRRLWEAADQLRAGEYSVPVLGLIFLKYAGCRFEAASEFLSGQYSARRGSPSKEADQAQGRDVLVRECLITVLRFGCVG